MNGNFSARGIAPKKPPPGSMQTHDLSVTRRGLSHRATTAAPGNGEPEIASGEFRLSNWGRGSRSAPT